jgi:ABC-2 type transport system permease protein
VRTALTLAWRDLRALFLAPTAYVVLAVYLFLGGLFYVTFLQSFTMLSARALEQAPKDPWAMALLNLNQMVMRPHLWDLALMLLFLVPLVTMRLLAEERRAGTAELILTSPVRAGELVLGKFLAGAAFVVVAAALSLHYPLFLYAVGEPDTLPIVVGFVGLLLAGFAFVAVGLFASSLTDSPVVAAVLGLGMLLVLLMLGLSAGQASPELGPLLHHLSFPSHYQEFTKGVLGASNVLYMLSLTALALFATVRVVESHRWRG